MVELKPEKIGAYTVNFDKLSDGEGGTFVDGWVGQKGAPLFNIGEYATKTRAVEAAKIIMKKRGLL